MGISDLPRFLVADVNATCDRERLLRTPLHVAASYGHGEIVRRLIASRGVDLMHVDMEEHCALELAQMGSHIETACLLIDALGTTFVTCIAG